MSTAPAYQIDLAEFWNNPYPDLAAMRRLSHAVFVPQLDAILIPRRNDIFSYEKKIAVFSSDQPDGLMTRLMGQNMMRKDGEAHMLERKAVFPTVSPKIVKNVWKQQFASSTQKVLERVKPNRSADMVRDIAMPISAEALKAITGLTQISVEDMDRVSQGMIDGCANYAGDPSVEARCRDCTNFIDAAVDQRMPELQKKPDHSLLSVQMQSGLSSEQIRANIKLAISGGQNEPRDVIAGAVWALLTHPEQMAMVASGEIGWMQVFEEYSRWMSPIGMSPRRIAQNHKIDGIRFNAGDRVFLMFGSGNRDEKCFKNPDIFDLTRDVSAAISFGAGPHFCAGAWAAKCLIAEVALPSIFETLTNLRLCGESQFGGWAFRGPLSMPVAWS